MFKYCFSFIAACFFSLNIQAQFFTFTTRDKSDEYDIYSEENALENPGVVVGTITINNTSKRKNKYVLVFRPIDTITTQNSARKHIALFGSKTIIKIKPRRYRKLKFQPDYWDGKKAVYVFVWKRNSSDYVFSDILIGGNRPEIAWQPFSIKGKQIIYFGNIEINDGSMTVTFSNKRERDLYLIKKKFPNSHWGKYNNGDIILEAKTFSDKPK